MGIHRSAVLRVLILALAAVALVLAASRWPGDIQVGSASSSDEAGTSIPRAESEPILVPIEEQVRVCPGPERVGLADSAVREGEQEVTVRARAAPVQALPAGVTAATGSTTEPRADGSIEVRTADETPAAVTDARTTEVGAVVGDGTGVHVVAQGSLAPGLSAAQMYLGDTDEQLGLALTPCQGPQDESWLIGGGGQAGHSERLVLLNPGQSAVTAEISVLGSTTDPGEDSGGAEVTLEPGAREILLLDALAPSEASPVVRVVSSGGAVSAFLGDRFLEGTTDQGTELTAPVAPPSVEQMIVGFEVPRGPADSATVRVAVPGAEQAVVEVGALTASGSVPLTQEVTLVEGRGTADIAVSDLPQGIYALTVSSDEELVAAARVRSETDGQGRQDVAWAPAALPLGALSGTPLPQVDRGQRVSYALDLVAPRGGSVRLISTDRDGITREEVLEVSAGQLLTRDLGTATGIWLVPGPEEAQMYAAVRGEAEVVSRPADDSVSLDNAAPSASPPTSDRVSLVSVLPLSELGVHRSVATLTPVLP
ncbi:MAG: DUF5719 family protein [Ornithinimicrobium sp.]